MLGGALVIDGVAHTVVGVMPAAFAFPEPGVRFWVPYAIPPSPAAEAGPLVFTALGRLKTGVTVAQAEAEGTAAARAAPPHSSAEFFFGKGGAPVVHARPLAEDMTVTVRPALSTVAAAAALVLLIACANVASLLLSRSVARQRELAIRAAMGGTRARLVRLLLTESSLMAVAGSTTIVMGRLPRRNSATSGAKRTSPTEGRIIELANPRRDISSAGVRWLRSAFTATICAGT